MYGWRARIGFINPSSTMDTPIYDFYRMAPPGVTMVGTNMGIRILNDQDIARALEALDRVAETYRKERVDIVVLGGSPPVILGGIGSEKKLAERMERASGTQATTSQAAAVEALKALGVKGVAVASPFDQHQNGKLKEYLEASGFKVPAIGGLGALLEEIAFLPTEKCYKLAMDVVRQAKNEANGIYLPCAQWPHAVENIAVLEQDTGLPVVTSLQAMLWYCLRRLGIRDQIKGFGRLFEIQTL
jgi:maleate cis-trans isomerase